MDKENRAMKLIMVRHGETDWNLRKKIQGSNDIELNKTGIMQANELGTAILESEYKIAKVFTSKQKRAERTAQIVSEKIGVDYLVMEGLEEMSLGLWEGLNWTEVENHYPVEYEKWRANRRYIRTPQGESYQDLLDRLLPAMEEIVSGEEGDILVVSHSAVIMCLLAYLKETPFEKMVRDYPVNNAELIEIDTTYWQKNVISNQFNYEKEKQSREA